MNNDVREQMYCNFQLANGTSLEDFSEAFMFILPKPFVSVQCKWPFHSLSLSARLLSSIRILCFPGHEPCHAVHTARVEHATEQGE